MIRLPTLTAEKVIKALGRAGFIIDRHNGTSHVIMLNQETRARTAVPLHAGKDLDRGLMKRILKQAGLTEDEFRKLL